MRSAEESAYRLLDSMVVQILATADTPVGTGFFVTIGGLIATCEHVVRNAVDRDVEVGADVGVALGKPPRRAAARVKEVVRREDLCVLELVDTVVPYGCTPALLARSDNSYGRAFVTKGYRSLGPFVGFYLRGTILGPLNHIGRHRSSHFPPIQLEAEYVVEGMSGAPIFDIETRCVAGMITSYWREAGVPSRTAFATPAEAIADARSVVVKLAVSSAASITESSNVEALRELLALKGLRVLAHVGDAHGLLFECQKSDGERLRRILVGVVDGAIRPGDILRVEQAARQAKIYECYVLSLADDL